MIGYDYTIVKKMVGTLLVTNVHYVYTIINRYRYSCSNILKHVMGLKRLDRWRIRMPVHEVRNKSGKVIGYKWGRSGKTYRKREDAEKQARAIYASGYKEKK